MPNTSSFGAETDSAVVSGTVTDRQIVIPDIPPQGLMSVGPRATYHYIKEPWNAETSYQFNDVVRNDKGASYVAVKPTIPAGTALTDEEYWFKWNDPDAKFDELEEVVKTYNGRISQNASAIAGEVARATAAESELENTKAPINHASEETAYGIGNELNYGHVRLAVDDTPMTSDANAGIAATPKMVGDATKRIMVVVGDSWSNEVTHPEWATTCARQLGCELVNKAISGEGWTTANGFVKQLESVESNEAVKYVVAVGGINDLSKFTKTGDAYAALGTEISKFVQLANNKFPNAKVFVNPMNTPAPSNPKFDFACIVGYALIRNCMNYKCTPINLIAFQANNTLNIWADDTHLNQSGMNYFRSAMLSYLTGGGGVACVDEEFISTEDNVIIPNNICTIKDGVLTAPLYIQINASSEISAGTKIKIGTVKTGMIKHYYPIPGAMVSTQKVPAFLEFNANGNVTLSATENLSASPHGFCFNQLYFNFGHFNLIY